MMTLVPIRDIQLEKSHLATLAEKAGDTKLAASFRDAGPGSTVNPSAIKDSPVWTATHQMYAATTNRVTGKFEKGYNVANHFDFEHLPGKKWDLFWDPEGILSTIPAVATCLLGVFAGLVLQSAKFSNDKKLLWLFGASLTSPETFATLTALASSLPVKVVLAGLIWAYCHHFCAGIRFLLLDLHIGIEKEAANKSAAAVLAVSIPLTLVLWGILL